VTPSPGKSQKESAAPGGGAPGSGLGDLLGGAPEAGESAELQYGEQASTPVDGDSGSSTAGAILLGLLAGCVLFGLALAARKGWMHWRYGL
jgi:hypothetical protein